MPTNRLNLSTRPQKSPIVVRTRNTDRSVGKPANHRWKDCELAFPYNVRKSGSGPEVHEGSNEEQYTALRHPSLFLSEVIFPPYTIDTF
jgi:hypothetical protein